MVHGAVRSLFQLLGALVVGLLIALPLFVWRLSSGPIKLDFLTPYIEEALTAKDGGLSVRLDTTVLALGSGDRMVEIRAIDVKAFAGNADQPIATVPEVADFTSYVGLASPMDFNGLVRHYYLRRGDNVAEVRINLAGKKNRELKSHAVGLRMRNDLQAIADVVIDHGLQKFHTYAASSTLLNVETLEVVRAGSCYENIRYIVERHFGVALKPPSARAAAGGR